MQFKYSLDARYQIVIVKLEGTYDVAEYIAYYQELMFKKKMDEIRAIIWDASELNVDDVTVNDMNFIIDSIKRTSVKRKGGKAAWVVKNRFGFGMGRMFEMMSEEELPIEIKIFYRVDDAIQWVKKK